MSFLSFFYFIYIESMLRLRPAFEVLSRPLRTAGCRIRRVVSQRRALATTNVDSVRTAIQKMIDGGSDHYLSSALDAPLKPAEQWD